MLLFSGLGTAYASCLGAFLGILPEKRTKAMRPNDKSARGQQGLPGMIFTKSQNKIQHRPKLYRLVQLIDDTRWVTTGADVRGGIYDA